MNITLSDSAIEWLLKLQAIEKGRVWNYTRIEESVNRFRYRVFDQVLTEVMNQIEYLQK
jgi:hypothetical protein